VGALALYRCAVVAWVLAGRTRGFEGEQTNHTLRVRDVPLPARHREPALDLHLHISMSLEEESVLQLALASEAEGDYIPGFSPEKRLFRGVGLDLKSPNRKKHTWSLLPTPHQGKQAISFLRKSTTHLQPALDLPAKIRAVRSKRRLDPIPANSFSHSHTSSDLAQPSKGVLDRSIRENRPQLLDHQLRRLNVRLKKKGESGYQSAFPELLNFPSFFGNGAEFSPRQILAARKVQYT